MKEEEEEDDNNDDDNDDYTSCDFSEMNNELHLISPQINLGLVIFWTCILDNNYHTKYNGRNEAKVFYTLLIIIVLCSDLVPAENGFVLLLCNIPTQLIQQPPIHPSTELFIYSFINSFI